MPPKKRDKEGETTKTQRSDAAKNDHDLFLQAFESEYCNMDVQMCRQPLSPAIA